MKLQVSIESDLNRTSVRITDLSGLDPRLLHSQEGFGVVNGREDVLAIDQAIDALLTHRRRLMESKTATIREALEKLHDASAGALTIREDFRHSYPRLYDALNLSKYFLDQNK